MHQLSKCNAHRNVPWDRIVVLYLSCSTSVDQIATRFGVSKSLVAQHLGAKGYTRLRERQTPSEAYHYQLKAELLDLHDSMRTVDSKSQDVLLKRVETWCRLAETGRRIHGLDRDPDADSRRPMLTLTSELVARPVRKPRAQLTGPKHAPSVAQGAGQGAEATALEPVPGHEQEPAQLQEGHPQTSTDVHPGTPAPAQPDTQQPGQ